MKKFLTAVITKIDEDKREVTGVLAEEAPDKDNEIFDYAASKPYFEKWNSTFAEKTAGKSVGNLRAMHQPVAAGKFVTMEYDDAAKKILVTAKVTNDDEWNQCVEGVYTGFSIGARVVGKKTKDAATGAWRYTGDPFEGSLVDNPCMYGANFTAVKGDQTAVAKFMPAEMRKKAKRTEESVEKLLAEAQLAVIEGTKPEEVRKGLCTVSYFAQIVASLNDLAVGTAYERDDEQDGSPIPEQIKALAQQLGAVLVAYVKEEVAEAVGEAEIEEIVIVEAADAPEGEEVVIAAGGSIAAAEVEAPVAESPIVRQKTIAEAGFRPGAQRTPDGPGFKPVAAPAAVVAPEVKTAAAEGEIVKLTKADHSALVAKAARVDALEADAIEVNKQVKELQKRLIPTTVRKGQNAVVVKKSDDAETQSAEAQDNTPLALIKKAQQRPNQKI